MKVVIDKDYFCEWKITPHTSWCRFINFIRILHIFYKIKVDYTLHVYINKIKPLRITCVFCRFVPCCLPCVIINKSELSPLRCQDFSVVTFHHSWKDKKKKLIVSYNQLKNPQITLITKDPYTSYIQTWINFLPDNSWVFTKNGVNMQAQYL